MFDVSVRHSEASHLGGVSMLHGPLGYSAAHATLNTTVLDGDHVLESSKHFVQEHVVQRLDKTHVVMGCLNATLFERFGSLHGFSANGADAQEG